MRIRFIGRREALNPGLLARIGRAEETTRHCDGLGLFIARQLMRRMGGELHALALQTSAPDA